ncbi:MAG: general secretion pathway protein GspB [Proteobacteria bacterium]|nr:general secretion pathway protein GspB [Pseudomonadota bacterium]MBU1641447.1 general secretion pathway protein GspB [Pseudomonadota bacterium]
MSYILDALKKSDKQRQQEHVPDLNTVQIELPPEKTKKAWWPLPLAAMVLLNVIFILFFMLRQDPSISETQAVSHNADRTQAAPTQEKQTNIAPQSTPRLSPGRQELLPLPAALVAPVGNDIVVHRQEGDTALRQGETPGKAEPEPEENAYAGGAAHEIAPEVASNIAPQEEFNLTTERESADATTPAEDYSENSDLDQSLQTQHATPADSTIFVPNASLARNPLHIYQLPEIIRQQLPEIHIDAHLFYKDKPASRFASINGKIMREGYVLAPDLKVAEITTDGVIFSYQKYLFYVSVF